MSLRRGVAFGLLFSAVFWAAGVAGCRYLVGPPAPPLGGHPVAAERVLGGDLAPAELAAATLDGASDPRDRFGVRGRFRVVHGRASSCRSDVPGQGNPLVWPDYSTPPNAGQRCHVVWTVELFPPYGAVRPAYLLVSFGRPAPGVELSPVGYDGCVLLVDTNPQNLFALFPDPSGILQQNGNFVELDWTPPASFAGVELRCQLVVSSPGANHGGWLLSPGLELWIGRGDT